MKILFLTSSAPQSDGDATSPFILTMAQALQALGHEVTILAPHAKGIAARETLGGVRIIRFRYAPEKWQSLTDGGNSLPRLSRAPLRAMLLPFFAICQAWALYRLLRTEAFDVLHSHWLLPQGLIGALVARAMRCPHAVMLHGADVFSLQHPLWLWMKKQALARTQCVIANSHATATAIAPLMAGQEAKVIPVGALPAKEPIAALAERSALLQPELLFAGRLFDGKGLPYLLQALALLPPAVRLAVYGDGEQRGAYEALAQKLGVAERVIFHGVQPHAQLLAAMGRARCFAAPSVTTQEGWREAQGNAIAEAMLRGLPVVASDSGGIGDAITHEQTGLLVPERDPEALAAAIQRVLEGGALAQRLADNARGYAALHLTAHVSAEKLEEIYQKVSLEKDKH